MVNYESSKIFKIVPKVNDPDAKPYVGSTTKQYLSQRMDNHRSAYRKFDSGKTKAKLSSFDLFQKYGIDGCEIVLIENFRVKTVASSISENDIGLSRWNA